MGRYFSGDIEGKFWFAVQSSNDADFFGSEGYQPPYLEYHFDKDEHLKTVNKGIEACKKELGSFKKQLDKFFKKNEGYNNQMLEVELQLSAEKVKELLQWYARLELGEKIRDCLIKNGECYFEAEY